MTESETCLEICEKRPRIEMFSAPVGGVVIIIIIIITLFESQIILVEHECCTNWGDCKSNKSNQIKSNVGF